VIGAANRGSAAEEECHDFNPGATPGIERDVDALASTAAIPPRAVMMVANDRDDAVERARIGDLEAFEELYRASVGRVHGLCLRMCRDPHLAEELTQESYILAWRKLATFRGDSRFSTWLHRIAVNVILGHFRSAGRRLDALSGEDAEPVEPVVLTVPGLAVDLERAIAGLPTGARTVFVLHDVEGYTHEEIAQMAGVAVGTSKAQLSRARTLLRKVLST
jgi:RNA polymerase sigma-70 factor (ECF subfamily)